jgi:hypothetical protein
MNPLCSPISRRRSSGSENGDKKPKVPTLLHFGDQDHSIPLSDVASRWPRTPLEEAGRQSFQKHITGVLCYE